MNQRIKLLDVVALTEDLPARKLGRGQMGPVVEWLGPGGVFEVEFTDHDGGTFASPMGRPQYSRRGYHDTRPFTLHAREERK